MGGRQIRPATVWKTKSAELQQAIMPNRTMDMPPWMDVLYKCPPSETLVRTVPPRHRAPSKKATKPRHIYRPQPITFPEDKLRQIFFKDHPWELARPRVLVETDGKDYQHVDWSKGLRQPGLPLTGEWYVERRKGYPASGGEGGWQRGIKLTDFQRRPAPTLADAERGHGPPNRL